MSKAKTGLPEISVDTIEAKAVAQKASVAHDNVAVYEKEEKQLKADIATLCEASRETETNTGNFIGLVRIVPDEGSPVRCEFRMNADTSPLSDSTDLEGLFGASHSLLFERVKIVTAILDPKKVLADMGPDAWDYLELRIKEGRDGDVIAKTTAVAYDEALLPKKDFLISLKGIVHTFSDNAKEFLKTYLKQALKPIVTVGGRG